MGFRCSVEKLNRSSGNLICWASLRSIPFNAIWSPCSPKVSVQEVRQNFDTKTTAWLSNLEQVWHCPGKGKYGSLCTATPAGKFLISCPTVTFKDFLYIAAQYNATFYKKTTKSIVEHIMDFVLTKVTTYLGFPGELWGFLYLFVENDVSGVHSTNLSLNIPKSVQIMQLSKGWNVSPDWGLAVVIWHYNIIATKYMY